MSLLAALVLALLGALGTGWIVWLRRESERDSEALAEQLAALSVEVAALRTSLDAVRLQVTQLRGAAEATRAELADFVHGPPSVRQPVVGGA
jgi:hypothetical protein